MKKNNSGFTLVETAAVAAILGMLLALLLPQASQLLRGARRAAAVSDARATAQAVQMYLDDVREEGNLTMRTLHALMGSQLEDPEGPLAGYLSGGLSDARIVSVDVDLQTGVLEEMLYENEDTQVKLVLEEGGLLTAQEIADREP